MGAFCSVILPVLLGFDIMLSMHLIFYYKYLPNHVRYSLFCEYKGDVEGLTFELAALITGCFIEGMILLMFLGTGRIKRIWTVHLPYFRWGLVIGVLMVLITLIRLCHIRKKTKQIKLYQDTIEDIENRQKELSKMRQDVYNDYKLSQKEKNEHLKMLNETEKALDKSYADIKQAYNAYMLIPTLKGAEVLSTDSSKEDLQRQLDVLEATQKL